MPTQSRMASPDFEFSRASMNPMDVACFLMILLLSAFIPMCSLLTRRTLSLFGLTSSCNHKWPRRCASFCPFHVDEECVLLLVRQRSVLASLQNPSPRIMLWTPFASDAPNAAAYSSASALLLAMIFCFSRTRFQKVSSDERDPRA